MESARHSEIGLIGLFVLLGFFLAGQLGCHITQERLIRATSIASSGLVQVTTIDQDSKYPFYQRLVSSPSRPSERTQLLLRKYSLDSQYESNPELVIDWFQQLAATRPTMEEIHALAEIAEIQANWARKIGESEKATRLYAVAVVHAHQFLFDPKLNIARNAYDPQFRSICDVYNRSLEGVLRKVISEGRLATGETIAVGNGKYGIEFEIQIDGRWKDQIFERFELVNNYKAEGLENHYHTYGLGVPLIAVRQQQKLQSDFEKYYPPEITIPMTAFMHLLPGSPSTIATADEVVEMSGGQSSDVRRAILKLYDPLEQTMVKTETIVVPLESDITTPLAYGLRDPLINKGVLATASLLNAEYAPETYGMFMLEPYDPTKIPVVMVHGLWSGPATWVHMFNDLRSNRDIHENYQFWFYSYPTGQPFWISAQQMRADLAKIRQEVDPRLDSKPLDQMVLVGHSMGGLISEMQTMESDDRFWSIISDEPIDSLKGEKRAIEFLRDTFYFRPNSSIERVITLATPFRGSEFSNRATQWVSQKLFTLPSVVTQDFQQVAKKNKDIIKRSEFLTTTTSIDSLAPTNPVFEALETATQSKAVKYHNIIGRLPRSSFLKTSRESEDSTGDGVVSIPSARNKAAISEVFVEAEHSEVHQNHGAIFEVRRILLEHLADDNRIRLREIPQIPVAREAMVIPTGTEEANQQWR